MHGRVPACFRRGHSSIRLPCIHLSSTESFEDNWQVPLKRREQHLSSAAKFKGEENKSVIVMALSVEVSAGCSPRTCLGLWSWYFQLEGTLIVINRFSFESRGEAIIIPHCQTAGFEMLKKMMCVRRSYK